MRKIVIVLMMVMLLLFASISTGYGKVIEDTMVPYFVSVHHYIQSFEIDSSGNASFSLAVQALNNEQLTQVKAIVKITNKSTGVIEYNKTLNMPYSYLYNQYKLSDTYKLTQSGIYEFQVTYKCYGNGVLLETITANPKLDSF